MCEAYLFHSHVAHYDDAEARQTFYAPPGAVSQTGLTCETSN